MISLKNSVDFILIPGLSTLSFILCFMSIIIFKDKKLNYRLYKYLKVKSIYDSLLSLITLFRFVYICKDVGCSISDTYFSQFFFVYIYVYFGFICDALTNFMDILITIERYYTLKQKKKSKFYKFIINPTMLIIVNIFLFVYYLPYPMQLEIVSIDRSSVDLSQKNKTTISKSYVLNDDRFNLNLIGYMLLMLIHFLKLIFFIITTIFSGIILYKLSKHKLSIRFGFNKNRAFNSKIIQNRYYLKSIDSNGKSNESNIEENSSLSNTNSNKTLKTIHLQKLLLIETKITFMILFMIMNCVLRNLMQTMVLLTPFMTILSPSFIKLIDTFAVSINSILRLADILLYYVFNIHYRELFNKKFFCKIINENENIII